MQEKNKKKIDRNIPVKKNESYEVQINGMTSEGNGVARVKEFTVFVPGAAVGDTLRIKIVKVLKNYAFAIVEKILIPSVDRVEVDCPVFRQCGGCCYRHISYEAELAIKEQQVKDCFTRLGGISAPCEPIVGSEEVNGYRNKAQFPLGLDANGKAVAGFYAKHSHRIVPCTNCALQPPIFSDILAAVLEGINTFRIPIYEEETGKGILRHVYLRIAGATGEIMLCLVASKKKFPYQKELIRHLAENFPQIKSIVLNYNPKKTNVILGEECITLYGADVITDVLCGVKVQISPLSFYQVNKKQAEKLYQQGIVYADPQKEELLLDLYCGIGTIGLSAVEQVKELIGVEIIPQAIENAERNAALNGFTNTRFLCGDCKTAVQELESEGVKPDIILVDPPRKGCDEEVIATICRFAPKKLVMISCNPATAARDCKLLEERGYEVISYRPFDLFPRTSAVECAVCLRKK